MHKRLGIATYKGDRKYITGADIYQGLVLVACKEFGPQAFVNKLVMHDFCTNDCVFCDGAKPENTIAQVGIKDNHGDLRQGWVAESEFKIEKSIVFDESMVPDAVLLNGERVEQIQALPFLPIEIIVSMAKYLHNKLFGVSEDKRWIFVQLNLTAPLGKDGMFTISLKNYLANKTLTQSSISQQGKILGVIGFSEMKK